MTILRVLALLPLFESTRDRLLNDPIRLEMNLPIHRLFAAREG
jgi:hypothetical protein